LAHGQEHAALDDCAYSTSLFSRLAGYENTNDAERLSVDPTMRQVVGGRATEHSAASTSQMGRFETKMLTQPGNLKELTKLSGKWIDLLRERQPMRELILDMDSSVSETYGDQEGTASNGHFGCTCYHPLFCFNQYGDVEQSPLRDGNVHSAKDWRAGLEPVVARYQGRNLRRYFRADAAFAHRELYVSIWKPRVSSMPSGCRVIMRCCGTSSHC
jgi:hypothetical protein